MQLNKVFETRIINKPIIEYIPKIQDIPVGVYVNEELKECSVNIIDDVTTITFEENLNIGDILSVHFEVNESKIFTRRATVRNELLSLYSINQKLKNNASYKFLLNMYDGTTFEHNFKSMYSPYYAKIQTVRDDVGDLFENINDDVIARFIFDNSLLAEQIITEDRLDEVIGDGTDIPLYVRNYVRYKTDLDLIYAVFLAKSGKVGKFEKTLGSLTVTNEYKLADIADLLDRFQRLLKPNEDALNPGVDTPLGFRKAGNNEYTVIDRKAVF